MNTTPTQSNLSVLLKMEAALNAHDIDALVNCFTNDFVSEQPVHPERNFIGAQQVRKNWSALFAQVPDLQAKLVIHMSADIALEVGFSSQSHLTQQFKRLTGMTPKQVCPSP